MSRGRWLVALAVLVSAVAVACGGDGDDRPGEPRAQPSPAETGAAATTVTPAPSPQPTPDLSDFDRPLTALEKSVAQSLSFRFRETEFAIRSIDLSELVSGGPGKDGIPTIADPQFVTTAEADAFLDPQEPVIALVVNGEARAYPIQILIWHEIAIDSIGGVPVAVTFCPLCNTAIVFDRRVDGVARSFGVSGLLRRSDLIMFDRTNESLWQQITGEAIVGVDTGTRLAFLPSQIVAWEDFRAAYADALVLSRETGYSKPYGSNPYAGYDRIGSSTIFRVYEFDDDRLDGKERVLTVELDGDAVAFPFSALSEQIVIETEVAGQPVVAFWQSGAVSALDGAFIVGSRNIGAAGAFRPFVDGERVTFEARDGQIVDSGTGSVWSVLGHATAGPLQGTALEPVLSANHFWFSWVVFRPETRVIRTDVEG